MKKSKECPVLNASQQPLDLYLAIATCNDAKCAWWNNERQTCGCMFIRKPPEIERRPGMLANLRIRLARHAKRTAVIVEGPRTRTVA